ncbi:MAG: 50S ribosomal protein L11 methyltransferase [Muribaculaceae bacterium]|nr:50S ribosomal protein L11 methyltransferase [Muribaculaceae bacterium]
MTDYIALRVDLSPCSEDMTDLLAAFLADCGYESFCPDKSGLTAYIRAQDFDITAINNIIADFPIETEATVSHSLVKGRDWNEEWEKHYFKPIVIGGQCVVHSTFHKDIPEARYDIVIDPKMAFGTGHHATTTLMAGYLLDIDLDSLTVIDMGTGTGILAILAVMRGASEAIGIEIDPAAYRNALENITLNNTEVNIINGDASALADCPEADLFIANINRNVITSDIGHYVSRLKIGGTMLLSGFYMHDIPIVEEAARQVGLEIVQIRELDNWCGLRLIRNN